MLPHDGLHNVANDLAGEMGKEIVAGNLVPIPCCFSEGWHMGHSDDVGILAGRLFQYGRKMPGCFVGQGSHRPQQIVLVEPGAVEPAGNLRNQLVIAENHFGSPVISKPRIGPAIVTNDGRLGVNSATCMAVRHFRCLDSLARPVTIRRIWGIDPR